MNDNLIEEARGFTAGSNPDNARVGLIKALADALEVAEKRATEAEAALAVAIGPDSDERDALITDPLVKRIHQIRDERDAALAVIEKARGMFQNDGFHESPLGRLLSSVPADVLRERDAEKWDEGARWAAVECAAIDDERQAWIAPGDNPYRIKEENNDN